MRRSKSSTGTTRKTINGRKQLCYCKFCGDRVIYSSEDDESCADGFYKHSRYPFVMDTLFVQEGTPCGFGYIDVMRDAQMYIDKLFAGRSLSIR